MLTSIDDAWSAFLARVVRPLQLASVDDPAAVQDVLHRMNAKLAALAILTEDGPETSSQMSANETLHSHAAADQTLAERFETLTRNQKAQVRQLWLLEALMSEPRPFSNVELFAAVRRKGVGADDGEAAMTSQLHRMKDLGLVSQPNDAKGVFAITSGGMNHLREMQASIGRLLKG